MLRPAAVALLMLLLAVPAPALAQDEPVPVLADDEGDVYVSVQGTQGPAAASAYPAVDLVALQVSEEPGAFTFVLQVADLRPGTEETGADGSAYTIGFAHNGREFRLDLYHNVPAISGGVLFPSLSARDSPDAEWAFVWGDPRAVVVDYAADLLATRIPREVLADADGAVPYPGRSLEGINVASFSTLSGGTINVVVEVPVPTTVADQMPEPGEPFGALPVQLGVTQDGHARLFSAMPFRASNGEATTYVFQVVAQNLAPEEDVMELAAVGVPARLTVVLPVPLVVLGPNETQEVPVLVTVPFGHDHGSAASFILELHSQNDPRSVGRLAMGVRFLAVPQPAGHHDTLFLHSPQSAGAGGLLGAGMGYMNTLEEDPNDALRPMHSTGLSIGPGDTPQPQYRHRWTYALGPALEMGLDADLSRTGAFAVPVRTTLPMLAASMQVTVMVQEDLVFGPGFSPQGVILAASQPTAPVDMLANAQHLFEGELVPDPDGDEVPYAAGSNLYLHVELTTVGPVQSLGLAQEGPAIPPGGWLRLPLNEWHDRVDDALRAIDGPALHAVTEQERRVNPGEAVVFHVEVENPMNRTLALRFEVTGSNSGWASLPDDAVSVPPDSVANVTVVVRAPADAVHGERADLILQAYPAKNPAARGLLRLVAIVETGEDLPDEAATAEKLGKAKDTPAPGFLLAALALVALAARRRR